MKTQTGRWWASVVLPAGLLACEGPTPGAPAATMPPLTSVGPNTGTAPDTAAPNVTAPNGNGNTDSRPSGSGSATASPSAPGTDAACATCETNGEATSSAGRQTDVGRDDSSDAPPSAGSHGDSNTRESGANSTASDPEVSSQVDEGCRSTVNGERPAPLTLSGNTFAHDPTVIKAGDSYYRFWTGEYVPSARSTDLRNWVNTPSVYDGQYPAWVSQWLDQHPGDTFNFPWAPDVSYFGGKYHLYASFSAFFGRNASCITHLSTTDLADGGWTDHGPVICSESGDDFNAIDADVGFTADGAPYLAFGSFWDGIFAFALDDAGNRVDGELTRLASAPEIEAPVLFYRCGYYYLFVSHGLCCPGEGRSVNDLTYRVVVGRADNVLGPYVDRDGNSLLEGGGTMVVQGDHVTYAAAGHGDVLVDGDKVYHVYHAYRQRDAGAELRIVELPFDAEGWPVGGAP